MGLSTTSRVRAWLDAVIAEGHGEGCRDFPFGTGGHRPTVSVDGRKQRASHYVLEQSGRARPDGMQANHVCDRAICCAPWHLYWGTAAQNSADGLRNGVFPLGESKPGARLTETDVRSIRRMSGQVSQREIAARYGIAQSEVSRIVNRKAWRHVA